LKHDTKEIEARLLDNKEEEHDTLKLLVPQDIVA